MDKLKTLKLFGNDWPNFPVSPGSTNQNIYHIGYYIYVKIKFRKISIKKFKIYIQSKT